MKKQQTKGWAVFEPKGHICPLTFAFTRKTSLEKHFEFIENTTKPDFKDWQTYGWTCRKVIIKEY